MKKNLLLAFITLLLAIRVDAQCVPTCSNYATMPITYLPYSASGNTVATSAFYPNADDGYTSPIQIGFNFNYYCTTYSTVLIYTNGLIQFDIGQPSTFPLGYDAAQLIPNPSSPTILNGIVCFRMDDLDPSVGGTITYTTMGLAPTRTFVVTYSNVPTFGNASLLNSGQIALYETTNMIDIITISAPLGPNLATQGIENASGTVATAVPGRNQSNWSATSSAYRFAPFTPAPPLSISGATQVCQGTQNIYTSATANGATSYSWALPSGWSGSSTTTALTATAGASGNLSVSATYTCGMSAPAQIQVSVVPAPVVSIVSADPFVLCDGTTFTLTPSGAVNYTVLPGPVVSAGGGPIVITSYGSATYSLIGQDATNCLSFNTATVDIVSEPTPTVSVNSGSICIGQSFVMQPSGANAYNVSGGFLTVTPNTPGVINYSVTGVGTGSNQCPSIQPAIASLTVYAVPSVSISAAKTIICKNETVTLAASGANTYSWTGTGVANSSIAVSPQSNTNYTVVGTTTAGCVGNKVISIVVSPCTGIGEQNVAANHLQVFPNPSTGQFRLVMDNVQNGAEVEIYSVTGQLVLSAKTEAGAVDLDLGTQPDGVYYLRVKGEPHNALKLVKH